MIGKHYTVVLAVLAREHNILAINHTRKKCHALVLNRLAVQSNNIKSYKIFCFYYLRQNTKAVVSCIGCIICRFTIIIKKLDKPRVFYAALFNCRGRKYHALGYSVFGVEFYFIIGFSQPVYDSDCFTVGGKVRIRFKLGNSFFEIVITKLIRQLIENPACCLVTRVHFIQLELEKMAIIKRVKLDIRSFDKFTYGIKNKRISVINNSAAKANG